MDVWVVWHRWEGEAPAEPGITGGSRLGRSLALPFMPIAHRS
jgi:hypothetical protein